MKIKLTNEKIVRAITALRVLGGTPLKSHEVDVVVGQTLGELQRSYDAFARKRADLMKKWAKVDAEGKPLGSGTGIPQFSDPFAYELDVTALADEEVEIETAGITHEDFGAHRPGGTTLFPLLGWFIRNGN